MNTKLETMPTTIGNSAIQNDGMSSSVDACFFSSAMSKPPLCACSRMTTFIAGRSSACVPYPSHFARALAGRRSSQASPKASMIRLATIPRPCAADAFVL